MSTPSRALAKRSADNSLMPPPPPVKRIKRPTTVLEEDTYLEALSHIIKRDFFPSLLQNEAQREFLDALESGDKEWIGEAAQRVDIAMTPGSRRKTRSQVGNIDNTWTGAGETPRGWVGDTPGRTPALGMQSVAAVKPQSEPKVDLNMSLSAFQATYTTEDAESFNALLDKQNLRNRDKNAWIWSKSNKLPSKQQLALQQRNTKMIADARGDVVNTMEVVLRREQEAGKDRPALPDYKRGTEPRNALMFLPESVEDQRTTIAQQRDLDSKAPPKVVSYQNTRIAVPEAVPPNGGVPPSPSLSAIDAALRGMPKSTESEVGYSGAETPRVAGYSFVDAEPTAAELAATRGLINNGPAVDTEAVLLRIKAAHGGINAASTPLAMTEVDKRERLHHKMVDRIQQSKRELQSGPVPSGRLAELYGQETPLGKQATPRFPSAVGIKRSNIPLTPAGQRLLRGMQTPRSNLSGSAPSGRQGDFGKFADTEKRSVRLAGVTPKPRK